MYSLTANGSKKKNSQEKLGIILSQMKNKNTVYPDLRATVKTVLRGKFITLNPFLKKRRKMSNHQPNFTT